MDDLERDRQEIEALKAQMAADEAAMQMLAAELQQENATSAEPEPAPQEDELGGDDEDTAQLERERQEIEALKAQMAADEAAMQMLAAELQHEDATSVVAERAPSAASLGGGNEAAAQVERQRLEIKALKAQMAADEVALAETRLASLHETARGPDGTQEAVTAADIAEAEHRLRDHWLSEGEVGDRHRREEMVYDSVGDVVMRNTAGVLVAGWLVVTSYRVIFLPRAASLALTTAMLSSVEEIEPFAELSTGYSGIVHKYAHIRLRAKDARALYFIRDDSLSASISRDKNTSLTAIAEIMRFQGGGAEGGGGRKRFLSKIKGHAQADETVTMSPELVRLCQFHEKTVAQMRAQSCEAPRGNDSPYLEAPAEADSKGLGYFSMEADFSRMGVGTRESNWRLTRANETFLLCSTYPRLLATPKIITDEDLFEIAKFRSKQRIPVLTWINPDTQAAIVRCAQPLVGLAAHHSDADENLFKTIARSNPCASGILVADARPYANAIANKGRKGGFEDVSKYEDSNTELIFLNIDNIHVMRRSLQEMHELVRAPDRTQPAKLSDVLATGWLSFVGRLLGGAATMVETVSTQKRTVIVHCSDGWDRTAQLSGLAQLCLDPYYRTCKGFQVLFQKEWLGFGHKCRDRTWGHKLHERSPIMMQFLDAVHQVMHTFPEAFEFNELLLIKVVDSLVTNSYSDFRFNNERERLESLHGTASAPGDTVEKASQGCPPASFWHVLHDEATASEYRNSRYDAAVSQGPIRPPLHARVWTAYFNRWISDPIKGQPSKLLGMDSPMLAASTETNADAFVLPEITLRHSGWMWKEGKRHKEFKKRHFVLYDSACGEASLVYYEEEKSGALVPKGMIALRQGAYEIGKPKRPRVGFEHAFRLDVELSHTTTHNSSDKATGSMKALIHRGSGSHPADTDGVAHGGAASTSSKSKKKGLFTGRRRTFGDEEPENSPLAARDACPSTGVFSTAVDGAGASATTGEFAAKKTVKYILAPETQAERELWMRVLDSTLGTAWAETREQTSSDSEEDGPHEQSTGLMAMARSGLRAGVRRMSNKGAEDEAMAAAAAMFAEGGGAGGDYAGLSEGVPPDNVRRMLRSSRAPDPEDDEHTHEYEVEALLLEKMETHLERDDDDDDEEGATADLAAFESLQSPSKSATATADALRLRLSTRVPPQ